MNEPTIRDGFTDLGIFEKSADAWTSSRDLARVFEKSHDHVLRDITKTISECDAEFSLTNFGESKYTDSRENVLEYNDTNPDAGRFALTPEDLEDL